MTKHKLLKLATAAVFVCWASSSFATDGSSGTTSSGTADISVTIPALVQITKIGDASFTVASYDGTSALSMTDDICIYSNMDTGVGTNDYSVTITASDAPGTGAGAVFSIGSAATDQAVAFTVAWNDVSNSNSGESAVAASGNTVTTQTGWSNSTNCGGAGDVAANTTARLHLAMSQANLLAVEPGTYTNTLTILITPTP